jgi:hypothetical protein
MGEDVRVALAPDFDIEGIKNTTRTRRRKRWWSTSTAVHLPARLRGLSGDELDLTGNVGDLADARIADPLRHCKTGCSNLWHRRLPHSRSHRWRRDSTIILQTMQSKTTLHLFHRRSGRLAGWLGYTSNGRGRLAMPQALHRGRTMTKAAAELHRSLSAALSHIACGSWRRGQSQARANADDRRCGRLFGRGMRSIGKYRWVRRLVTMIERSDMYALLVDGTARAIAEGGGIRDIIGRMTLLKGYAKDLLADLAGEVVLIDPMHPPRKNSALVNANCAKSVKS